jgi:hypothetical protein
MKFMVARIFIAAITVCNLGTARGQKAEALPSPTPSTSPPLAEWAPPPSGSAGGPKLKVQLTRLLSSKQVRIIEGGFSTVTQLIIHHNRKRDLNLSPDADDESDEELEKSLLIPLRQVGCSVKFDAWQETFEVIRLLDQTAKVNSVPVVVKTIDDFGDLCLTTEIELDKSLSPLAANGGEILATMIVKQTSLEETSKIKEWLIQQQSGVIQSLFSHMLGELTLQQTVRSRLSISAYVTPKKSESKR